MEETRVQNEASDYESNVQAWQVVDLTQVGVLLPVEEALCSESEE